MNIIIAGAGTVGFNLAKTLCIGHDVTVIDQNEEALHRIQESLDILPVHGNIEDSQTYEPFKHLDIDLFIAVTNIDNVNLIATMIADSTLSIDKTIVRLQKYFKDVFVIKEKMGVDDVIFPIRSATKGVMSLLNYPKANNIKLFRYTKHKLISIKATQALSLVNLHSQECVVIGIERDKEFFIPSSESSILVDDLVYFFGAEEEIRKVSQSLESSHTQSIEKCVVYGGDSLGVSIAKALLETGRDVKLIEKDLDLCIAVDQELEGKATVINAKYGSHELFEEENLDQADMFVATSKNDEFNIIKCLEAKEKGIEKIIAINNDMEYYNLMHSLGIVATRGPKISAYHQIMEKIDSRSVVIQKWFCGSKAVVLLRKITSASNFVNKKIKPIRQDGSSTYYIREESISLFDEEMLLLEGDIIIIFTKGKVLPKLKQWIYGL
jgi:trk system potassium uptake protein TrkA